VHRLVNDLTKEYNDTGTASLIAHHLRGIALYGRGFVQYLCSHIFDGTERFEIVIFVLKREQDNFCKYSLM
jgi:hypothetical protein